MVRLSKSWHGPTSTDSKCPLLVLLPPGPLIYSSNSGCFCHPVTRSSALTFWPPGMAAGPCSHLLAPILRSGKDVKLNALQGRGGVPSSAAWDPSWPTARSYWDSPVFAWPLHAGTCSWACRHHHGAMRFHHTSKHSWISAFLLQGRRYLWIMLISVTAIGKLRQGGVMTYPTYMRTRRAELTLSDLPAMKLVTRGITALPRSPTSS